jgi:hypothetical protein
MEIKQFYIYNSVINIQICLNNFQSYYTDPGGIIYQQRLLTPPRHLIPPVVCPWYVFAVLMQYVIQFYSAIHETRELAGRHEASLCT